MCLARFRPLGPQGAHMRIVLNTLVFTHLTPGTSLFELLGILFEHFWGYLDFRSILGALWEAFGSPLGALGDPLGTLGDPLGGLWGPFGRPWGPLGTLGDPLGGLWDPFGRPWVPLGSPSAPFGSAWKLFGAILGSLASLLEPSWPPLGAFWDPSLFVDAFGTASLGIVRSAGRQVR